MQPCETSHAVIAALLSLYAEWPFQQVIFLVCYLQWSSIYALVVKFQCTQLAVLPLQALGNCSDFTLDAW